MINAVLKWGGMLLGVYAFLIALMYVLQAQMLFRPDTNDYSQAQVGITGFTDVSVTTSDNLKLKGWYAAAQVGKPTILFFQGNASSYQWRAPDFMALVKKGYGVLLAGYRGYGGNKGTPSEEGLYRDAEAYLEFLKAQNIPENQIVLYGESLGTGVAIELAYRHRNIMALLLEAPYASIAATAAQIYPFVPFMEKLVTNRFDSIYKIGALTMPKFFMLAGEDRIIPNKDSLFLYQNAPQPKAIKVYKRAGHNDMRSMGAMDDAATFLAH
ncbi:MAG: alpha/beta hydrolase [Alphaproteobacteria bacterium]|nr:alpha/beta hydrolase [Alphaproteobacteria bacterium]